MRSCHFDLAASVQATFEEFGVRYVRKAMELCGSDRVCLTGGVALNGLMNEAIRKHSGCRELYIFPASGDDGTAAGAALLLAARDGIRNRKKITTAFFGPSRSQEEIERYLGEAQVPFGKPPSIHEKIAAALADGKVVARYLGASEFGPRALGHRSILAHPGRAEMKDLLNRKIKHREPFRPFAPACLEECAAEFFELDVPSPFMLLIPRAREAAREKIPAAIHHDGTARVQTVNAGDNPEFYETIRAFQRLTGLPVVLNTSFNINGEAIVETPQDAVESFAKMEVDYLAIGDCWLGRESVKHLALPREDAAYLELRRERYRRDFPHFLRGWDLEPDPWAACFARPPRRNWFRRFAECLLGQS
jgi:carbamoyltransferase